MENYKIPKIGERYRHFKGDEYEIVDLPLDGDYNDDRVSVVYVNLHKKEKLSGEGEYPKGTKFSCSLERFCGEKIFEEDCNYNGVVYKKGDVVKRFTKIHNG